MAQGCKLELTRPGRGGAIQTEKSRRAEIAGLGGQASPTLGIYLQSQPAWGAKGVLDAPRSRRTKQHRLEVASTAPLCVGHMAREQAHMPEAWAWWGQELGVGGRAGKLPYHSPRPRVALSQGGRPRCISTDDLSPLTQSPLPAQRVGSMPFNDGLLHACLQDS